MKKIILIVLILLNIPAWVSAFNLVTGSSMAVTGGDPPTGTILVGDDTGDTTNYNYISATSMAGMPFTAIASGTGHTIKAYIAAWDATAVKAVVYSGDSPYAKLSESDPVGIITGIQTFTLNTPVTVTLSGNYILCLMANNYLTLGFTDAGTGYPLYGGSVTYPTAPDNHRSSATGPYGSMQIWLEQ